MTTGPMRFGEDNNAGSDQTRLRTQGIPQATLWIQNQATPTEHGRGLTVQGGTIGVRAEADLGEGTAVEGEGAIGVTGTARGTNSPGVRGTSQGAGNGVEGRSPQSNGVQGVSNSGNASGVYGENTVGGYGIAGRTFDNWSGDRAAVFGESLRTPGAPSSGGKAAGVYGYSETGYGGVFISGAAGLNLGYQDSGGIRIVGKTVQTKGSYLEAVPHSDGSQRLLHAPMSPESWFEDYGRAHLVEGRVEVELDPDFAAVLGIEDGEYHVFLTPEGDTQGLYVESRRPRSFIVREQQAGTSNTTFSYRVAVKDKHRHPERLEILEEPEELTSRARALRASQVDH